MPTDTFTCANDFVEHLAEKVHNLSADALTLALSNTAPASETNDPTADGNGILANVTQIAYTNLSSRVLTIGSSGQIGGTYKLVLNDLTLSASGGAVATFRYVYIYNDTPTSPADAIIGVLDYGAGGVTLADGESLLVDMSAVNGVLQLAIT